MTTKLDDAANVFNSSIKFLARAYATKKKGTFEEEKALRNNKRLAIIIAQYPLFLIKTSGPYFLKYAEIIQKKDFNTILQMDFQEEKKVYKKTLDGSKHSFEAMDDKIKFLKNMFKYADSDERTEIVNHLQILLSSYCKYALIVKESTQV